jgi:hypothetical protein
MWGEVNIGSNLVSNTTGIIRVAGAHEPLMRVERGNDGQLLLTVDVYNQAGERVAKLRHNAWVYNDTGDYEVTTHPQHLTLRNTKTGQTVVQVVVVDQDRIKIPSGILYAPIGGHETIRIAITPDSLHFGGVQLAGNTIEGFGDAFVLGPGSITTGST